MNETSDKKLSFGNGQTVWNYFFLAILFFTVLLNNSLVLAAMWTQKHLQSLHNSIILASMAVGTVSYCFDTFSLGNVCIFQFTECITEQYYISGDRPLGCRVSV